MSHTINPWLLGSVIFYMFMSIAIGFAAARRVHTSRDFMIAGRALPLYIVTATVFATWFGSETIIGTSSVFIESGLAGIVADPFGAAMCLILVGVFFAGKLYRMNLLTIGDFYRLRYNRKVELLTSIAIILSYLGWVAAQLLALGLVFEVVSGGWLPAHYGTVIGAALVLVYTVYGGMWSVAITDFVQMIMVMVGLLYVSIYVGQQLPDGVNTVIAHAAANNKFEFWPKPTWPEMLAFFGALITMGFGSIPQQDVFQRVMAGRTVQVARWGAILGGVLYLIFAFVPIFLAYSAFLIDPKMVNGLLATGETVHRQYVLPNLVMNHAPLLAQIIFFGALISAIKSTASGTLLAPSTVFAENIIYPLLKVQDDQARLRIVRIVLVLFTIAVTLFALYKAEVGIFNMVENAYKVTLVAAFVPLVAGLYWKRANTAGALTAMALGVTVWILFEWLNAGETGQTGWDSLGLGGYAGVMPPQLAGFLASVVGMLIGTFASREPGRVVPIASNEPIA